jgi:hypothetical protein
VGAQASFPDFQQRTTVIASISVLICKKFAHHHGAIQLA